MKNKKRGFTLVETIIAVAILAVVTVPVMGIFVQTSKVDSKARQIQKATDLAQNVMESIRSYSMEEIMEQCMGLSEKENTLAFLTDWCPSYNPSGYQFAEINDETQSGYAEELLDAIGNDYTIWGNADENGTITEKSVDVAIKGDKIRFAFRGLEYNSSIFDIIISFDAELETGNLEYIRTSDVYYLYAVSVSVYQSMNGAHQKLVHITGAVQNKKNTPMYFDETEEDNSDDTNDENQSTNTEITDYSELEGKQPSKDAYDTGKGKYWNKGQKRWYPFGKGLFSWSIARKIYYDYYEEQWYPKKYENILKNIPVPENKPW